MTFRKVSSREPKFVQMKTRFENTYNDFKTYAEELTLQKGKAKNGSGKAGSYARYLMYLAILYEEIHNEKISDLSTKQGLIEIEKLKSLNDFDEYNVNEGRFPNATLNCYRSFMESQKNVTLNISELMINEAAVEEISISATDLIQNIYSYITSKGFNYSIQNITNLYLSLRSKPFVIISGISGTGKTKIVQLFAESIMASEDNGQFMLVPVRPDWSDGSELLGYTDIKGDFIEGQLTKLINHAIDYPERPHFLLLDEMNLARVEYYFSDILSIMESRKIEGDEFTSSRLALAKDIEIYLPGNVYIVGTVNMDETTHPFSKKVLDRANTIEFNEIELNSFEFLQEQEVVEPIYVANESIQANYIQLKSLYDQHMELVHEVSQQLTTINGYLSEIHAQVGYRVRDEICFYMAHNVEGGNPLSKDEAFDFCLMQKILPRIAGSGTRVEKLLQDLEQFMEGRALPRSKQKLAQMQRRLNEDEFTSFWIA